MKEEVGFPAVTTTRSTTPGLFLLVGALIVCLALPAFAGSFVPHNTPNYVKTAKNLGPEDPAKTMEVSVWLKPHNRSQLDALARQVYDRNSPSYRHFLNRAEVAKMIAPSAAEAATVQKFLEAQGLKVVKVGPDNFFVRAQGAVRDVETAFHVQLNNYQVRDKVIRANASDPYVEGDAAELVFSVSGLDSGTERGWQQRKRYSLRRQYLLVGLFQRSGDRCAFKQQRRQLSDRNLYRQAPESAESHQQRLRIHSACDPDRL
jgi:subtilase family serine protease